MDFSFLYLKLKDFPYQVGPGPVTRNGVRLCNEKRCFPAILTLIDPIDKGR